MFGLKRKNRSIDNFSRVRTKDNISYPSFLKNPQFDSFSSLMGVIPNRVNSGSKDIDDKFKSIYNTLKNYFQTRYNTISTFYNNKGN